MRLSVVIPARNEQDCIESTVLDLHNHLCRNRIDHEIIVINDGSTDDTAATVRRTCARVDSLSLITNPPPNGFGLAVRKGLDAITGDAVAIYMADASDRPEDLVRYVQTFKEKAVDCVFGSRFIRGARVVGYPWPKYALNRLANAFIRILFGLRYNDVTNAFKLYSKEAIEGTRPFLSHHFNITVELPLKAIVRGYTYAVVANDWYNRKAGVSKLKIAEMGSRYLFIVLYCLIEKWLCGQDYHRGDPGRSDRLSGSSDSKHD